MSAVLSAAGALAKGLATLERLLDSEDEKVALKAAELLLRLHPDVPKRKGVADDAREGWASTEQAPRLGGSPPLPEGTNKPSNAVAKKLLLSPFNVPPPSRNDPLPGSFRDGTRPLTSFLKSPKSAATAPG